MIDHALQLFDGVATILSTGSEIEPGIANVPDWATTRSFFRSGSPEREERRDVRRPGEIEKTSRCPVVLHERQPLEGVPGRLGMTSIRPAPGTFPNSPSRRTRATSPFCELDTTFASITPFSQPACPMHACLRA